MADRFEIILAPEALEDLKRLPKHLVHAAVEGFETHLRNEPKKISRSRIKRLRQLKRPQYRLRNDALRVYYDVNQGEVEILAILEKQRTYEWLERFGIPDED